MGQYPQQFPQQYPQQFPQQFPQQQQFNDRSVDNVVVFPTCDSVLCLTETADTGIELVNTEGTGTELVETETGTGLTEFRVNSPILLPYLRTSNGEGDSDTDQPPIQVLTWPGTTLPTPISTLALVASCEPQTTGDTDFSSAESADTQGSWGPWENTLKYQRRATDLEPAPTHIPANPWGIFGH